MGTDASERNGSPRASSSRSGGPGETNRQPPSPAELTLAAMRLVRSRPEDADSGGTREVRSGDIVEGPSGIGAVGVGGTRAPIVTTNKPGKTREAAIADLEEHRGAGAFVPERSISLKQLDEAAQGCRGCDLYKHATQAVFGHGPKNAPIMLIGEQPGDQEDKKGRPFVGPAGGILRSALAAAGIEPDTTYLTNAVKHFKWVPAPKGKRRIHAKPTAGEIRACRPWLLKEIEIVRPQVIVVMGVSAGQALLGATFKVGETRGKPIEGSGWAPHVVSTIHPSAILRAPDDDARHRAYEEMVKDLRVAAKLLKKRADAEGGVRKAAG